ncbi:MAG: carbamoyltransferase HypF [bacterium]|nr:carbamoyltransferase HypF [bacterium]
MANRLRVTVELRGRVQGVGMRPWVLRRARALGLDGSVRNVRAGLRVELEGTSQAVDAWLRDLREAAPNGARIEAVDIQPSPAVGTSGFEIAASDEAWARIGAGQELARVPLDVGLCSDCQCDLFDPASRRHRHAFVHCSECGPRASVIRALPYDRARTSLAPFPPCEACAREYADPTDRRFHAQTICCEACGPRLRVLQPDSPGAQTDAGAIETTARVLGAGGIVAVQGFGGFHLACDATSSQAINQLRKRKHRPSRPLAILVPDLESARRLAELAAADEALLCGPARALVVAPRRERGCTAIGLAPEIAPGTSDLGLLLPHSPVHAMLLYPPGSAPGDAPRFDALVMTSANHSGDPTIHEAERAVHELAPIADLILGHDRQVIRPSDDPVFRSAASGPIPIRLSRSTAPLSIPLPAGLEAPLPILALGGDLKCAPAIAVGREIVLAEHVGDLGSPASADALVDRVESLCSLLGVEPAALAMDAHPDGVAASLAAQLVPAGAPRIRVQHHHAHALACLAEHDMQGPALAITLDGAGFGADGRQWGGELLYVDGERCERLAHLETVPLPGGDRAAREPWRMAAMWLERAFPEGQANEDVAALGWHRRQDPGRLDALREIATRGVASPETSSCGRLFDAVASLLGVCDINRHEAEAGAALEALARTASSRNEDTPLPLPGAAPPQPEGSIEMAGVVRALVRGRCAGVPRSELALAFHQTLADRLAESALAASRRLELRHVALSGGCFQNRILLEALRRALENRECLPLCHAKIPPNDAGLAVGQCVAAIPGL